MSGPVARVRRWFGANWRSIGAVVVVLCLVGVLGFLAYFATPHHAREGSVDGVRADPDVAVSTANGTYVLEPAADDGAGGPETALVFYPGARVHPDAYVPPLAPLAEAGVTVYVTHPPLNLAVLDPGAAGRVLDRHPEVDRWYVGGHSLGGATACRYAAGNAGRLDGLVLFASDCDRDLRGTDLRALTVTGREDPVLNRERAREARSNLPEDATVVQLEGVNHSQFGAYTGQRADRATGTGYAVAHERLADVLVPWFQRTDEARERLSPPARVGPAARGRVQIRIPVVPTVTR